MSQYVCIMCFSIMNDNGREKNITMAIDFSTEENFIAYESYSYDNLFNIELPKGYMNYHIEAVSCDCLLSDYDVIQYGIKNEIITVNNIRPESVYEDYNIDLQSNVI
jgi:hypothetical protein